MTAKLDLAAADRAAISRLPRCACGARAFAFRPGTDPERDPDLLSFPSGDPKLAALGELGAAWCEQCWPCRRHDEQ